VKNLAGGSGLMALSPQFLDELRARVHLVDVISRRVKLIRKGREFQGLCPFHNEKTPSFAVVEDKGFFHCFGCGAHGDVISFVMRMENLGFPQAVERLAQEAGLEVPRPSPEERKKAERYSSLAGLLDAACVFYEEQLKAPAGREGLDYFRRRGLDETTIARFRLGYAPVGNPLRAALLRTGNSEAMLLEAGLLGRNEERGESYDYFRNRVIFPIADARGRVVAFGGRVLGDDKPKYLNSRDSDLFHKGRMLYGLAHARRTAQETGQLLVVEGYMDVIALHQAGFGFAVAPLGTALTEAQIEEMWRLVDEPILCFDGDEAGARAAGRAVERVLPILKPGKSLRFVSLPAGQDPDSLVRGEGPPALRDLLARARPLVELVWEMEAGGRAHDTPERRAGLQKRLQAIADRVADERVRKSYGAMLRERYWQQFGPKRARGNAPARPAAEMRAPGDVGVLALRQRQGMIAALVNHPSLMDELGEQIGTLPSFGGDLDKLRQEIIKTWAPDIDSEELKSQLKALGYGGTLERILSPEVYALAPFAHPAAAVGATIRWWRQTHEALARRSARPDIDEAERELAENMTEESLARLHALQRQLEPDADDAVEDERGTPPLA
jgi:DNA primase